MKIITKKIEELNPAEYNPRVISEEALKGLEESVKRFGYVEPIIWNRQTNRVVGGHQRLEVLKRQGIDKVQVVEVDLTEKEEKALNITLNNQNIQGEWDNEKLQSLLEELKNEEYYNEITLGTLELKAEKMSEINVVDDDVVEVEKKEINLVEKWGILVFFDDELKQKDFFKEMQERGFECKSIIY